MRRSTRRVTFVGSRMKPRVQFGITAAFFCHLLLAVPLVTSQLPPAGSAPPERAPSADLRADNAPQADPASASQAEESSSSPATSSVPSFPPPAPDEAVIRAREQEKKGDLYTLRGDVEIDYAGRTFRADEVTYDRATGEITATGHLIFDGGPHDEHLEASHGEYNVRTETGKILRIVSNDLDAPADEIAELYKRRWQIELFFRWVKHTLKIRHFYGTSENAVRILIAVALIAFLLLRMAHALQNSIKSLLTFTRLVGQNLMQRRAIQHLLGPPPTSEDLLQLSLSLGKT